MKKFTAILIILTLTLALAGCGTPPEHYAEAVENYRSAAGATCSFTSEISLTEDTEVLKSSVNGRLLISNGEIRTASLTASALLTPASGSQLTLDIASYFDGSKYYGSMLGSGICYQADWQEFMVQTGFYGFAENLTETDFEGILSEETETGEVLTYVVPAGSLSNWTGITEFWNRIAGTGSGASITSIQGTLTLDQDRNPVKQEIEVNGSIATGGTRISVVQKVTTDITLSEEAISVGSPAAVSYTEIEK